MQQYFERNMQKFGVGVSQVLELDAHDEEDREDDD